MITSNVKWNDAYFGRSFGILVYLRHLRLIIDYIANRLNQSHQCDPNCPESVRIFCCMKIAGSKGIMEEGI